MGNKRKVFFLRDPDDKSLVLFLAHCFMVTMTLPYWSEILLEVGSTDYASTGPDFHRR